MNCFEGNTKDTRIMLEKVIAVVVPNLTNVFETKLVACIENSLQSYGYSLAVATYSNNEQLLCDKIKRLKKKVVGFVIMPTDSNLEKIKTLTRDMPVVLIDSLLDNNTFDSITVDNQEVVYRYVKKLLNEGIRKIAVLESNENVVLAHQRANGYKMALDEVGIAEKYNKECVSSYQSGYQATKELLMQEVEAIFAWDYNLTVGAMIAIRESNKRVKLIGFDAQELSSNMKFPLEIIVQPVVKIGEMAIQLLFKRIINPEVKIASLVLKI
jgi:DNA-binding LacI/PurR family transcriptional regulator